MRKLSLLFLILFIAISAKSQIVQNSISLKTIDINKAYGLSSSGFRDIFIDKLNRKWFGTINSGMIMLDGRTYHRITIDDSISSNFVFRINQDSKGNIWAATSNGVTELTSSGKVITHFVGKEKNNFYSYVYENSLGDIYAMGESGISIRSGNTWEKIDTSGRFFYGGYACSGLLDTSFFVGKNEIFYNTINTKKFIPYLKTTTQNNYKAFIDKSNRLWIISLDGLGYVEKGVYHLVNDKMGFLSVAEYNNRLFFGTNGYGLFTLLNDKLILVNEINDKIISSLSSRIDGLWIGAGAIYKATETFNTLIDSVILDKAYAMFYIDKKNFVYVDEKRNILLMDSSKKYPISELDKNFPDDNLKAAFRINPSETIISTSYRLFIYNSYTKKTTEIKVPSRKTSYGFAKLKDTLFVARSEGLFKIMGDSAVKVNLKMSPKETPNISGITLFEDKILFFRPSKGLFSYANGEEKKISIPDNIAYHSITSISVESSEDKKGFYILMLHPLGMDIGFTTTSINNIYWQTVSKENLNALFLSGNFIRGGEGMWNDILLYKYQIDFSKIQKLPNPTFALQIVQKNDSLNKWSGFTIDTLQTSTLKKGTKLAFINWIVPSETEVTNSYHVEYIITNGSDTSTGINSDGQIQVLFPSAGNYKIVLNLVDNLNNKSFKTVTINLILPPLWYQTILFKIFIFIVILIILSSILFVIIDKRNKKNVVKLQRDIEILSLRTKAVQNIIAPHLLFNLFNNLQSKILNDDKEKATEMIEGLSSFLRQTIEYYNEDLTTLSDEINYVNNFVRLHASKLLSQNMYFRVDVNSNIDLSTIHFPSLILQPLVENAIKYGGNGNIIVLSIEIRDGLCYVQVKNSVSSTITNNLSTSQGHSLIIEKIKLTNYKYSNINAKFSFGVFDNGYKATISLKMI